jgi:ribosomal protein S19
MQKKSWKVTSKIPDVINYRKMEKEGAWNKETIIPNNLVGKTVWVVDEDDDNWIKSYITREKAGFKFGDFTQNKALIPRINEKIAPGLYAWEPDINIVATKSKNLKKNPKNKVISQNWVGKTVLLRNETNSAEGQILSITPRYRNKQKRKPRKPKT